MSSVIGSVIERFNDEYISDSSYWSNRMLYCCMGEDDEYCTNRHTMEDDYYDGVMSVKSRKKVNKKRYKNGRKDYDEYWTNRHTMYDGEYDEYEDYESPYKLIKYYPDINNELSVIEFKSLKEFDDYCVVHGIYVGSVDYDNLKNWGIIHCCLDPIDLEYGDKTIITDSSYGGLYWTVSDDYHSESVSTKSDKK